MIDILAIVPFDVFLNANTGGMNNMVRVARIGRLYKLVKLIKLLRLFRLLRDRGRISK